MWPFVCSGVWVSRGPHFTRGACSLLSGDSDAFCLRPTEERDGLFLPWGDTGQGGAAGLSLGHGRPAWGHKFHASFHQAGAPWEDPCHPHPPLLSLVSQDGQGQSLTRNPMLWEQGEPPSWVQREGLSARRFRCKGRQPASPV